jgi:hypothetical protein
MRIHTLAVVAALLACQSGQDQRPPPRAQARQASTAVAAQVSPAAYRLADVDRLQIDLPWSGGELQAPRVDVTTPQGRLYAQLPVQARPDGSGGGTATAVLEVRGTPIDGYQMVGTWRFALVDGGGPALAVQTIDLQ